MTDEIWKSIKGYKGFYEISNFGRVRALKRKVKYIDGRVRRLEQRIIAPSSVLYYKVTLSKDTVKTTFLVHRLMAEAFIPNPKKKKTINHKDGDKYNNSLDNLEWATQSENNKHSFDTGLKVNAKGADAHAAKLTEADVLKIRELLKTKSTIEVGKIYGMSRVSMLDIKKRNTWSNI